MQIGNESRTQRQSVEYHVFSLTQLLLTSTTELIIVCHIHMCCNVLRIHVQEQFFNNRCVKCMHTVWLLHSPMHAYYLSSHPFTATMRFSHFSINPSCVSIFTLLPDWICSVFAFFLTEFCILSSFSSSVFCISACSPSFISIPPFFRFPPFSNSDFQTRRLLASEATRWGIRRRRICIRIALSNAYENYLSIMDEPRRYYYYYGI